MFIWKIKGYFYIVTTEGKNNNWGKHQEKLFLLKAHFFSFLSCWQSKIWVMFVNRLIIIN